MLAGFHMICSAVFTYCGGIVDATGHLVTKLVGM